MASDFFCCLVLGPMARLRINLAQRRTRESAKALEQLFKGYFGRATRVRFSTSTVCVSCKFATSS